MTGASSTTTDPHTVRTPTPPLRRHLARLIGTTPSMHEGRLVMTAAARRFGDGGDSEPASSGDDTQRVAFCSEPGEEGLSLPVDFFFLKLR